MRKILFLALAFMVGISPIAQAQRASRKPILIQEEDGTPSSRFKVLKVTDGTLTDNGDGSGTLAIGSGSAPSDADYLVGTANGDLSAEIVAGTSPGGELGNTWASPTIDDSVAVTSWNLTTPTITTSLTTDGKTISEAELGILDGGIEGSEVLSTGEAGGTKFLREDSDGTCSWQTPAGSGSGTTTFPLYPYSSKLTGSYVTATIANLDVAVGAAIDAGDGNWRVLFDATTDEAVVLFGIVPSNYSATPVINIIYSMVSGTANEVEWEAAIQCTTPGDAEDIGTETFAAGAVSAVTVPGTAGHTDTLVTITPTDDSTAAGDIMYVYISTDANDATNDDATGDRELVGAYVSYTAA